MTVLFKFFPLLLSQFEKFALSRLNLMTLKYILYCIVFFFIFSLAIYTNCCLYAQASPEINENILQKYYHFLNSVISDSSVNQISALQDFLMANPRFERIYLKLLERFLLHNRVSEAKAYFEQLSLNQKYRSHSYWILAKISMFQNHADTTLKTFLQALRFNPNSLILLNDFIRFIHQQYEKSEGLTLLNKIPLQHAHSKTALALYHYYKKNYKQAIRTFSKSSDKVKDNLLIIHIKGDCYYELSNYNRADSLWRIGLGLARQMGDLKFEAQFLIDIGVLATASGYYDRALSYYDSSDVIATNIGDLHLNQVIAGNRGIIYAIQGDYPKAINYYKKAIKLASIINAHKYSTLWYSNYAHILFQLGHFKEALQGYDISEELARKSNDKDQIIEHKIIKADLYAYLQQFSLAEKNYSEAYQLAQTHNLEDYKHRAAVKLADLQLNEGEYEKPREAYQKYINFLDQKANPLICAYYTGKLAETYLLEKRYDRSKEYYQQGAKIAEDAGSKAYYAWFLIEMANLGTITGNLDESIKQYNSSLKVATSENNLNMLSQIYFGLGNAYRLAGNLTIAISNYTQAVKVIEKTRQELMVEQLRIGYFSEMSKAYQKLVDCYFQRYEIGSNPAYLDSLYYYDQLSRYRSLHDKRLRNKAFTDASKNESIDNEYQQICEQLRLIQYKLRQESSKFQHHSELDNLLTQLETARYSLIAQQLRLFEDDQSISRKQYVNIPSLSKLFKKLKDAKLGLLHYHISENASFVIVTDGDSVRVVRLQTSPTLLASRVDSLITPFHDVQEDSLNYIIFKANIAYQLYQLLIKPAEEVLNLPERLLIVPDLQLMGLPFEMLLSENPEKAEYIPSEFPQYADHFLLHRYTFVYNPSMSLLEDKSKWSAGNTKVMVFANPFKSTQNHHFKRNQFRSLTGWSFEPLPFSEVEAERIKQVYQATRVCNRDNATKESFIQEAQRHQVVHIATHAFVDKVFDAFSGLVLSTSQDSTDDGLLMGYEISDLSLKSDLITLSACETGRGKIVAGEGVLGLPRLFLSAGAKTVLMTLWKVDDRFTSELMPKFYDDLLNNNSTKADALRNAKLFMLLKEVKRQDVYYQHPFYWASFVLYGDPGIKSISLIVYLIMLTISTIILILIFILIQFHKKKKRMKS